MKIISIDDHLLRDEDILATAEDEGATFYATTGRVIRQEEGLFSESVGSIPYPKIASVSFESKNYRWLIGLGIVVIVIGAFIGSTMGLLLAVFGILSIMAGLFYERNFYQLRGAGISDEDKWRLKKADNSDVKGIARMIEDKITEKSRK